MILFLLTFFLLYGGMHWYVFRKIMTAFTLSAPVFIFLILLMSFMVSAPLLVRLAEGEGLESFAVLLAYAGYIWMGVLFLFFTASILVDSACLLVRLSGIFAGVDLERFLPGNGRIFAAVSLLSAGAAIYGYFEALDLRTERVRISTDKLPPAVRRLTIVQISDVHLGLVVGEKRLRRIIEKIREARPDLVVSTGDLVDGQTDSMGTLADEFRKLNPSYGKYAVTGNHEFYAGIKHAMDFTRSAGFTVLRGTAEEAGGVLTVAGVDDPAGLGFGEAVIDERDVLKRTSRDKFVLLLKHRPTVMGREGFLFDLQLSGHTHKGQIFPFNVVTGLFYPIKTGLSTLDGSSSLYVSRGTGTWGPPIRFLAPPEITVIELLNAETEGSSG